jgi:hypothetical protein
VDHKVALVTEEHHLVAGFDDMPFEFAGLFDDGIQIGILVDVVSASANDTSRVGLVGSKPLLRPLIHLMRAFRFVIGRRQAINRGTTIDS